jgi:sugar transferase EpsL
LNITKRATDISVAMIALLLLSPILAAASLAILLTMGRPIFFRQKRPGLGGKPFDLIKFRTMRAPSETDGMISDNDRITPVGRFLRKTSIDELPELWNVLRGDMSLVGPRPLLMAYLPRYTPEQARRHHVPPGITGWAQVNGRNALSWDEKFALDLWYVENQSFWLDVRILLLTVRSVLRREGIDAGADTTMPEFLGTEGSKSNADNVAAGPSGPVDRTAG